jgi:hypothetical protein
VVIVEPCVDLVQQLNAESIQPTIDPCLFLVHVKIPRPVFQRLFQAAQVVYYLPRGAASVEEIHLPFYRFQNFNQQLSKFPRERGVLGFDIDLCFFSVQLEINQHPVY